ncbi:hypothetical protein DYB25_008112 [Aphanomyces astaci]|uniref:Uncharacterized protein n=1 Tax=Aphanomyces astaci TaxID=112090 RepID=A0A397CDZ5_APHAT|nr:hypothetical protein DYB25_008112 [Aphanomyces astaci]RHY02629.1 hypothetical protein DYB36_009726 [Aphanomyces astaci]RHY44764.1 hypothetical protein DYB30_012722 [Aphanomyces astaci]RHY47513.1 hypothetical protein DYB34_011483 [Aphanomyces astaci]RHY69476.1 hypothetical protein DYB38_001733 [Aphanomyces astaci]
MEFIDELLRDFEEPQAKLQKVEERVERLEEMFREEVGYYRSELTRYEMLYQKDTNDGLRWSDVKTGHYKTSSTSLPKMKTATTTGK